MQRKRFSASRILGSAPIYQASSVPTFTFGGGMLWGDLSFAMGFEVAISYAGSPSKLPNQPTLPGGGTLTPASGAGSRWSLPIGIVLRF